MGEVILSRGEFATCAAYLTAGCGRQMGKEQMEVYYDALNDISFPVLKACCKRAIQEHKDSWLPSVGAIRSFASEAINGQLPQYSDEWEAVRKAISRFGWPRPIDGMASLSPLTQHAVKAIGGWRVVCESENASITGAQFRAAYEAAAKREDNNRRISAELRPVITSGPTMTPRIHDERRNEIQNIIGDAARRLKSPEEPAA